LPEIHTSTATYEEERIGKFIADNLVMDGATLQMGRSLSLCMCVCVCAFLCVCLYLFIVYLVHIHTPPFNGPWSGTTQVSRYQKGKTNLDFTEARDSDWQWHQLGPMQVCTSLQTDNHASIPPLSFFTSRMPFLPPNQRHQSTEGLSRTHSTQTKVEMTKKSTTQWKNKQLQQPLGPR